MSWKSKLRPASFRGVRFFIDSTDSEVGRKIQLHEYPKRDVPYAEDMGRVTRTYRFTAFVIGKDCFDQRDKLLEALEEEGSGELVHPYLGTLTVKCGACKVKHERTEGGIVRFDLIFFPGEDLSSPKSGINSAQMIRIKALGYVASAKKQFLDAVGNINIAGVNLNSLSTSLQGAFEVASSEFSEFSTIASDVASFVNIATSNPSRLPGVFLDATAEQYGFTGAVQDTFESFNSTLGSINGISSSFKRTHTKQSASISDAGGNDTAALATAVTDLIQDSLVLKSAGVASLAPVYSAPIIVDQSASLEQQYQRPIKRNDVPVANDVIKSRDDLSEAIWTISEQATAEHFEVLNDIRQAIEKHLSEVAKSGVKLSQLELHESIPSLVIAWNQFGDSTREGEVTQRNKIFHPGFVSEPVIWVASK